MFAYYGVKNVRFLENFPYILNKCILYKLYIVYFKNYIDISCLFYQLAKDLGDLFVTWIQFS